jgi:membrane protease YdiL (CAAX protease family)
MVFAVQCMLAGWLIAGVPLAGRRRYRALRSAVAVDPDTRLGFYAHSAARQWLLAAVAVALLVAGGQSFAAIGLALRLRPSEATVPMLAVLGGVLVIALGAIAVVRRAGGGAALGRRMAGSVSSLLPRTRGERWGFAGVAITAGVTEELLYRGFLVAFFHEVVPGLPLAAALVLSSAAFGLGHAYQGLPGVASTGVVGLGLATVYAAAGTLLVGMAAHAALDLRTSYSTTRRPCQEGVVPSHGR